MPGYEILNSECLLIMLLSENMKRRSHLGDLGVDDRTVLK
jgi:hypothetical protein